MNLSYFFLIFSNSSSVNFAGTYSVISKVQLLPFEPAAYAAHRTGGGGAAPAAGEVGTVYSRAPHGPSSEELAVATTAYLKAHCPEALESMVERKFAEMTDDEGRSTPWHVIWTPPYWPACQPIELVWGGGGKQRAGQLYLGGRNLALTRAHLRRGFYGGENHEGGEWDELDVTACVLHSMGKVDAWIAVDVDHVADGLSGTLADLRGVENWTGSDSSCLKITDMGLLQDEEDADLDLGEAGDGADDGGDEDSSDEEEGEEEG